MLWTQPAYTVVAVNLQTPDGIVSLIWTKMTPSYYLRTTFLTTFFLEVLVDEYR